MTDTELTDSRKGAPAYTDVAMPGSKAERRPGLLLLTLALCLSGPCSFTLRAQSGPELAASAGQAMQERNYAEAERLYVQLSRVAPGVPEVYSNLGLARFYQGHREAAESAFRTALRYDAHLFVPNFFLGKLNFEKGQYSTALPFLEEAATLQPGEKESHRLLAAVLVGLHRQDEAIQQYQRMLGEDPRDVEALYGLALIYLDQGKTALDHLARSKNPYYQKLAHADFDASRPGWERAAAEEYSQAINMAPKLPGPRLALGNLLLKSKNWDGARQAFEQELAIDAQSYEALYGRAVVALAQGDGDSAARDLTRAAAIQPEFFDPLPDLLTDAGSPAAAPDVYPSLEASAAKGEFGPAFVLAVMKRGSSRAAGWTREAELERDRLRHDFERKFAALSRQPLDASHRREAGMRLLAQKRFAEGIQLLTPLLKTRPADRELRLAMARAQFQLGRFEEVCRILRRDHQDDPESLYLTGSGYGRLALVAMARIGEIEPNSPRAHQILGDAYFSREMYKEAQQEYESAVSQADDPGLHFSLGNAYFKQFKFEEAKQQFARTLEMDPYDASAYLMEASALGQLHQYDNAVPLLQRALQLDSRLTEAHAQLGKALAETGQPQEAVPHLEMAAPTDKDGMLHFELFKVYRKLGDKERAEAALAASKKIQKENIEGLQEKVAKGEQAQ